MKVHSEHMHNKSHPTQCRRTHPQDSIKGPLPSVPVVWVGDVHSNNTQSSEGEHTLGIASRARCLASWLCGLGEGVNSGKKNWKD